MVNPGPPSIGVRPGDVLAGKYRVERILGEGGMGVVVAAHHVQLDERVALKFLLPEALRNPQAVARFLREARAVVKIKGEHVARVSDVGQLENGAPYIVMEYLEGSDLSGWLKQRGALPVELAVDFVLQACEALADAHALGIVHRDLKPANLFCVQRSDGQLTIKVLDFGISKVTTPGGAAGDMTRTNALVGSPYYMSPEQMQSSKGVDVRTDIWSLGVILFELLTGRPPFESEAVTELAIKIAIEPAPLVRDFLRDVPPALEQAIARCLEKDRERRFQTVGELAVSLRDLGSRRAAASVERVLGTLQQAGIANPTFQRPAEPQPPHPGTYRSPSTTEAAQAPSWGPQVPSASSPGATPSWAPRLSPAPHNTSASWGETRGGPAGKAGGKAALAIAGLVILGGLAAGGWWLLRKPAAAPVVPASASASAPVLPPASAAPPQEATVAPPPETVAALPPEVPAAVHSAVAANPAARPWTPGASYPGTTAASASHPPLPAAAPKANCIPPYFFDAAGHKQYKSECM